MSMKSYAIIRDSFQMKMYKNGHSVEVIPHMKALISGFLESEAQGHASSFILYHATIFVQIVYSYIIVVVYFLKLIDFKQITSNSFLI